MKKIDQLIQQRKWANGKLIHYDSQVFKRIQALEEARTEHGATLLVVDGDFLR